jgi:predicted dehydrogenase
MLNVAMVGLGSWARRMVDSVQGTNDTIRFTSAYSRTPAKIDPYCGERGIRTSDDLAAVVGDAEIGGVVVCSAAGVHASHAMAALKAGKHVLVIKPLALNRADAEALSQAAEARKLVLAMGYDRCFLPAVDELRRSVCAGDLGRILHAEGNFCVNRYANMKPGHWKTDAAQIPPGGLADHMLYTMIELMGPVAEVSVQALRQVIEVDIADTASVMLRFAGGASGLLTAIGVTPDFNRLHLFGSHGWAEIRGNTHFEFKPQDGDGVVTDYPKFDALKCELESFAAAAGEAAYPVSPQDAIHGVATLEAMFKSGANGKPVTV